MHNKRGPNPYIHSIERIMLVGIDRSTYTGIFAIVHLGRNQTQQAIESLCMIAQAILTVMLAHNCNISSLPSSSWAFTQAGVSKRAIKRTCNDSAISVLQYHKRNNGDNKLMKEREMNADERRLEVEF